MSLIVIKGTEVAKHASLMDEAFVLRHRSFVEELKWERLRKPDGREIDEYDNENAYHLIMTRGGRIAVYTRLLPTIHPHLLSDVYPQLAPRGVPRGPRIWEWTRMTVAPPFRGDGRWTFLAGDMVKAVVEFALRHGVEAFTWEGHPVWLTRFLQLGFSPQPLGLPDLIDGEPVLAAIMEVRHEHLHGFEGLGIGALA